jgi:hypothetical protein
VLPFLWSGYWHNGKCSIPGRDIFSLLPRPGRLWSRHSITNGFYLGIKSAGTWNWPLISF